MANLLLKRIKDWAISIPSFRIGDVIPVDGPEGTAKMSKDDLLKITTKPRIKKTPINLNDPSMWHSGGIGASNGNPSANQNRIYCDLTAFDLESVLSFTSTISGLSKTLYAYNEDGTYLGYSPSVDIPLVILNTYPTAKKFRLSMISKSSLSVSAVGDKIVFSSDTIWLNDLLSIEQRITKDEARINEIDESVNGARTPVNMNDPSIWNVGGLNATTGMPEASTDRLYSNKIAFTSDSEWPLVTKGEITNWNQFAYDKDDNFLGWRQWGSSMNTVRTSFPDVAYVRVLLISSSTRNTSDVGSTIIFQSGTTFEKSFDGLEDRMAEAEEDIQNLSTMSDILLNKKWYACGDSFTHGDFVGDTSGFPTTIPSGQYAGQNANYPYLIGSRTGCEVHNIAVNGSTLAQHAGSSSANCFTYPVTGLLYSIPSDADYITLYFGINDGHKGIPVGSSGDNDNTTFWGALNVALGYIVQNFPHARIGVIASNGCDSDGYPQAAVDAAKKWGVGYLDLDGAVGCRTMIRCRRSPASDAVKTIIFNQQKVSNDNSHPNAMAHAMESTFIEAWLKSL